MTTPKKRPDITKYQDPASFLRDWFQYLKATKTSFSLRYLARRSEVAVSYLTMMTQGKRPLTEKLLKKIAPHLNLSRTELRALEHLLSIANGATSDDKKEALNRLQRLSNYRESNSAELEFHQYLSKWYHVAIREMVQLPDFSADPNWIQSRLQIKISTTEIQQALKLLLKLGLIENNKGKYSVTKKTLQCHDGVFRLSLGTFHSDMLKLGATAIDHTPREQRSILGSTVALPNDKVTEFLDMVRNFQKKIETWAESLESSNEIYHLEIAAFPLTKKQEV